MMTMSEWFLKLTAHHYKKRPFRFRDIVIEDVIPSADVVRGRPPSYACIEHLVLILIESPLLHCSAWCAVGLFLASRVINKDLHEMCVMSFLTSRDFHF